MATPAAAAALISIGAACDNAPASTLDDADTTTTPAGESNYGDVIDCLNAPNGYEGEDGAPVLAGNDAGDANFASPVTRAQFAGIFSRIAEAAGLATDETSTTPFTDIDGAFFEGAIRAMYGLGLTEGKTATTYDTQSTLTIAQLATFYVRLIELITGETLPDNGTSEVSGFGVHTSNAEKLFDNGFLTADQASDGTQVATRGDIFAMGARSISHFVTEGILDNPFPAPSNVDFQLSPAGMQHLIFDYNGPTGIKDTTITVTGLDATKDYHVSLFENVDGTEGEVETVTMSNGSFFFRDSQESDPTSPFDSKADYECTSYNGAEIVSINDAPIGSQCEWDIKPDNGQFVIRLENSSYNSDAVWLVVWQDADNDDALDLNANNGPSEPFGAVGPILWSGGEAPTGNTDLNGEYILYVDHANQWFLSSDIYFYRWDSNDQFSYDNDYPINFTQFSSWFNANDYLYQDDLGGNTISYSRTASSSNFFDLYDEGSLPPMVTSATVGDFDTGSDTASNDVRLNWTMPLFGNMTEDGGQDAEYCIYRYLASTFGTASSVDSDCFEWGDNTAASDAVLNNRTAVIEDVPAGNWVFTVSAETADGYESDESEPSASMTTVVASGSPKSTATTSGDLDLSGTVTMGDVLTATFDQAMIEMLGGAVGSETVTVKDNDGTTCTFSDQAGSTFDTIEGAAGVTGEETLQITMTADPTCTAAGSIGGLQFPNTVTAASGVLDLDQGLNWDVSGSTVKVFS